MKFKSKADEIKFHLEKGGVYSTGRGEIELNCIRGTVWITWPGSGDVILREGDSLSVRQHGVLCVTSLTGSFVSIKRSNILPCIKDLPGMTASWFLSAVIRFIKGWGDGSAFGDSVHSITR